MTRLHKADPFIIAEVGSNWTSLTDCCGSISLAKACGADAVKFQLFRGVCLYGYHPENGWNFSRELPLDWLPQLKEKCDAVGIEFMCTPFSPGLVEVVDPYVEVHKVASSDLSYPQLLKAVAETGKPILLSTGASSKSDVELALSTLGEARARTTLLYCNASYPSTHHNLFQIDAMRNLWGCPVGLSDHSLDAVYVPMAAVGFHGASVIEKHFKLHQDMNTPDSAHSLDATAFKLMCDHLRGKVDTGDFGPSKEEGAMFLRHNRRLVATKDIEPGEQLVFGKNYGAFRSLKDDSKGLSPFLWNHEQYGPEGKMTKVAVKQGTGLGPGDF